MSYQIYKIDERIANWEMEIDEETGEVTNFDEVEALQLERHEAVKNLALMYKNITAFAESIKAEKEALAKKQAKYERQAEKLKAYITTVLNGEKLNEPEVTVSYKKSSSVEIGDSFIDWAEKADGLDLLTYSEPKPNRTNIKAAIKAGKVPENMAWIKESVNTQIK